MNTLITFGGARYDGITAQYIDRLADFGIDRCWVYDDVWFETHPFRQLNRWLWDHPGDPKTGKRGYGWYAFKTLIFQHALDHALPGDVVLYLDGDTRPVADLTPIFDYAREHGAMFFAASGHKNYRWCKRDCFIAMGWDHEWGNTERQAGCARFVAMRKGDGVSDWRERQFLMEWLTYSVNRTATTFDETQFTTRAVARQFAEDMHREGIANYNYEANGFQEHRTEQAIMTLLCHKYGHTLHREPCQAGKDDIASPCPYPWPLFEQAWLGSGHPVYGSKFRRTP